MRKLFPLFVILGMIVSTQAVKADDQSNVTLDPGQPTIAGAYQISANWSQLTRGKYTIVVQVTDPSNQPVSDATVKIAYDMVGMEMGPPDNPVVEKGNGNYEKQVFFGMRGKWKFDITVTKDSVEDKLSVEQMVK